MRTCGKQDVGESPLEFLLSYLYLLAGPPQLLTSSPGFLIYIPGYFHSFQRVSTSNEIIYMKKMVENSLF